MTHQSGKGRASLLREVDFRRRRKDGGSFPRARAVEDARPYGVYIVGDGAHDVP